jgi:GNAT superfamily N-acetyltransferase
MMPLVKIFDRGEVKSDSLYNQLQELDVQVFPGCGDEFLKNRVWWAMEDEGKIIAYCGCIYSEGVCIFNRAWVYRNFRGNGFQSKMIKARLANAKGLAYVAITYTTFDNVPSANNLIKNKFTLYNPLYAYAGDDKLYFKRELH